MIGMRRILGVLVLLIVACAGPVAEPPPTMPPSTTIRAPEPSTTAPAPVELPLVIEDCSAPQVGFSPLCESYTLIQKWHVDRPVDPDSLARAALRGLESFDTDLAEQPPRTLFCAIPDPAFDSMCDTLARRVRESSIPVADAIEAAVTSMTGTGLDPFSYYVPPEQAGSYRANGVVGGLGILLDATDAAGSKCVLITAACPLEIVVVLEDNPGYAAGLLPGDRITAVDGEAVDGRGFVDTATRLAGDETGSVEVEVLRESDTLQLTIERAPLIVPTVEIDVPGPGIGYLRVPDFEADIPGLVRRGLTELLATPIDRLLLDLRDNPGGYIDSAIEVASEFIAEGVLVRTVGPDENRDYEAIAGGRATDLPITALVNGGTASAAEIMAAALRDRRGAEIVGQPTFGKDAVQIAFDLDNGGEFNVAVARWLSPNGSTVAGTGIDPDRVAELPASLSTTQLAELAYLP